MPAIIGGDHNSYPVPRAADEIPLPVLDAIADRPHRLHRSYIGPDGNRVMDTRPDAALRTAGLEDLGWYCADRGDSGAVARTVNACDTHGPDARIDRIYATEQLLPAVTGVDVIEVDESLSDHHIVRAIFDTDILADILNAEARARRV